MLTKRAIINLPGIAAAILLLAAPCSLGAGPLPLAPQPVRTTASGPAGDRLPAPGVLRPTALKARTRTTGRTTADAPPLKAPMRPLDLTGQTKQAGVTARPASVLTPEIAARIARLTDPRAMRTAQNESSAPAAPRPSATRAQRPGIPTGCSPIPRT